MGFPRQVVNRWRRTREGPEPARVLPPMLLVWHMHGRKDELTSCRGTVQSAWQKSPVSREGGRAGLPKKGKWQPRGTGTTVLSYPCSSQPCTTARELQTCTLQGPGASNTTKIPRKDPQRKTKRAKMEQERGKKSTTFWAPPPFGAPTRPHPSALKLTVLDLDTVMFNRVCAR